MNQPSFQFNLAFTADQIRVLHAGMKQLQLNPASTAEAATAAQLEKAFGDLVAFLPLVGAQPLESLDVSLLGDRMKYTNQEG